MASTAPQQPAASVALALASASKATGVDLTLLRGIAWVESRYNPSAVGPVTKRGWRAQGLMQLGPEALVGVADPYDPVQNALAGAKLLAGYLKQFGGDTRRALAAYNWGPGNLAKHSTIPTEVSTYVANVLDRQAVEKPAAPAASSPKPVEAAPPPLPIRTPAETARAAVNATWFTCPHCATRLQVTL
jgi:soluble lytic murein transglycosylase-like protein